MWRDWVSADIVSRRECWSTEIRWTKRCCPFVEQEEANLGNHSDVLRPSQPLTIVMAAVTQRRRVVVVVQEIISATLKISSEDRPQEENNDDNNSGLPYRGSSLLLSRTSGCCRR